MSCHLLLVNLDMKAGKCPEPDSLSQIDAITVEPATLSTCINCAYGN